MPSTTNFGWSTPADTDYVTNGAAAMRTLGNGIDTTLVDLKGGTTDQVLAKNSNTDMDFKWVENGEVLLSTTTLSGNTTTITGISQVHKELKVVIDKVDLPANGANVDLTFYNSVGTNYGNDQISTFYRDTTGTRRASAALRIIDNGYDDLENCIVLNLRNYASTTNYKAFTYYGGFNRDVSGTSTPASLNGYGMVQNTGAINELRFDCASGAGFAGGTVRIYGVN